MKESNLVLTSPSPQPMPDSLVLHADPEHGGLRTAVTILLGVSFLVGYVLVFGLIRSLPGDLPDYAIFLSCIGALVIGLGVAYVGEKLLKNRWHSGRSITLDGQGVAALDETGEEQQFAWGDNLSFAFWFFHLRGYPRGGRERRVPNNWVCLSCQMQQEDRRLILTTYLPAKKAAVWTTQFNRGSSKFHEIHPAVLYDKSFRSRIGPPARPDIPSALLSGKDGKYWLAERRRWTDGYELTTQDFETFMKFIQMH